MGFFSEDHEVHRAREEYDNLPKHEAKVSHELAGGAAAAFAAHEFMEHRAKNGQPVAHETAFTALAGLAGAFIDREAETRGADFFDKVKAKKHAEDHLRREHERHGEEGRTEY